MGIEVRDLCRYYTVGGQQVRALDGVSLNVGDGEYLTVVGASGSGKSTLMNILGCLDAPSSGSYFLDGADVSGLSDSKLSDIRSVKIGFIFQSFNLIAGLSAVENVELPLMYRRVPKKVRREIALSALESVRLSDRALHRPCEMSGGQQQRVAIARAIAADPSIILADEPCGNLDSRSGAEVLEILRRLNQVGKTIVMITHNEDTARKAQRLVRISDGRIAEG
ncbi:MAG: ABC transporter ATP-binding protein [Oscillospiraceae bacterium]|nr:ABC transporter ATP-binding protein [Oscillospiraceae bacterium]